MTSSASKAHSKNLITFSYVGNVLDRLESIAIIFPVSRIKRSELCFLLHVELEASFLKGFRDAARVASDLTFCKQAQKGDQVSIRKNVRPHFGANLILKTGQVPEQLLVVTLATEYFSLAVASRASRQLVQQRYCPLSVLAYVLATPAVIRIGITMTTQLVRAFQ